MKDTRSSAELNHIIAEWMGWTPGTVINFTNGEEHYPWPKNAPDYCGDLNAVHEACQKLNESQREKWAALIVNADCMTEEMAVRILSQAKITEWHETPMRYAFNDLNASARQRAEALAKVIEAKGGK